MTDEGLLAEVGRKRGGLLPGGLVNMQKAAEIALNDFRSGAWGRVTLETPEEFAQWWAAGMAAEDARKAKKEARKKV
jgi:ribosome biogenesis GTPase A